VFPAFLWVGKGLLFLLVVFFVAGGRPALALELNALWEHRLSGGEEGETTSGLKQIYRASEGINLDLTDAISAGATISYNKNILTNRPTSEIWSPGAKFRVNNDIFSLGFSGTASYERRQDTPDFDTSNWRTSLAPLWYPWSKEYWPSMSAYYGESQVTSPGRIDSHEFTHGANLSWSPPSGLIKLFYGYDNRRNENRRSQAVREDVNHLGRLNTSGSFWDNRVSVNFSQSIQHETVTDSGIVPPSGVVELDPQVTFTYFSLLLNPTDPRFDENNFPMGDHLDPNIGNLGNTNTFILGPEQSWHLAVSPVFAPDGEQQVDQLRVYVVDPFGELVANQSVLHWDLYASFDNTRWQQVALDVTATYNSVDQRFEVNIPALDEDYQFFMVVVSNNSTVGAGEVSVNIRAVQSVPLSQGTPGSSFSNSAEGTNYTTLVNMGLRVSPTLNASSNLSAHYGAEYYDYSLHGSLLWAPSPIVTPSLSFNETTRDSTNREKNIQRTYTAGVPVALLPTLRVNFGATRTDRFTGDFRDSFQNSLLFGGTAILYPDLTASLTETYNTGESQNTDGTISERENFSGTLNLKARLTPKLRSELNNVFTRVLKPRTDKSYITDLNFYYRPSDPLSMELRLSKSWIGARVNSQIFALRMALVNTVKTRVTFSSSIRHDEGKETEKTFSLLGSWDISRRLTLKSRGTYNVGVSNSWAVVTSLYFRL